MAGNEGDKSKTLVSKDFFDLAKSYGQEVKPRSGWHTTLPWGHEKFRSLKESDGEAITFRQSQLETVATTIQKAQDAEVKKMEEARKINEEKTKQADIEAKLKRDLVEADIRRKEIEAQAKRAEKEAEREAEAQREQQKDQKKKELVDAEARKTEAEAALKRAEAEAQLKRAEAEALLKQRVLQECPAPDCGYVCMDTATLKQHFVKFHAAEQQHVQSKIGAELLECPAPDCGFACKDNSTLKRHFAKFHTAGH